MPPKKAPAAASKKAEVKKKEKIIEVSDIESNLNLSKKKVNVYAKFPLLF